MQQNKSYFSLSGLSGILVGVYGLLAVYIFYVLTATYGAGFDGVSQLPIAFLEIGIIILIVVTILVSLITLWIRARIIAKKNNEKLWGSSSKKLRFHTLIPIIIFLFILILIANRGYYSFITPLVLFFFGLFLLNLSRFSSRILILIALAEIILALTAYFISDKEVLFLTLGLGIFPILYGVYTFNNNKKQ